MGNKGSFKAGNVPWNKDLKGIHLSPETEFKEGQWAGSKSNTWKGGIQTPANDVVHLYDGVGKRVRRPKKVYEEIHGAIPKGWVILHIDGVMTNDEPDNLIAIPRAILVKLNSGRTARTYMNLKKEVELYLKENEI